VTRIRGTSFLFLCLCWIAFHAAAASAAGIEVTDSAGRRVEIPETIQRVMPAGPPAALLLYVLAPEKLVGWPRALPAATATLLPPAAAKLPVVGRLTGGKPPSPEAIGKLHPDVIVDIGDVEPEYVALADKLQKETGIPYLLFDGRLAATPDVLRTLGRLLGEADRGTKLADHAEAMLKEVDAAVDALPPEQRPGVYYARGSTGLQTGPSGSLLGELVDRAGARNLAPATGSSEPAKTSLAEIVGWNPQVIITQDAPLYRKMPGDPGWSQLAAIQAHRLYLAPDLPFGWIDEPPGINRLLGLRWLAQTLHPQLFTKDLRTAAREFCALFYQAELSEAQLDGILTGSQ
jgi:iron complex transport system substrate-binding protein